MSNRRRRGAPIVSLLFLLLLCILVAGAAWAVVQIPALAEREFGPANPALGMADARTALVIMKSFKPTAAARAPLAAA